ncbi:Peroxiredoxin [bacterium A37T11]|nr:Peroxiredoxin [bacterium A37T11]
MKLLANLLAFAPMVVFGQQEFSVKGKVGQLGSPAKAYIQYAGKLDSSAVNAGIFEFKGTIASPTRARVYLVHNGENIRQIQGGVDMADLYIEPGNVQITAADSLTNAKIEGGIANKDFQSLSVTKKAVNDKMKAVDAKYQAASDTDKKSETFINKLREEYQVAANEGKVVDLAFAKTHTSSPVSLDILNQYLSTEPLATVIEPAFNALSPALKDSEAGKATAKQIASLKATDIGAVAPDFSQTDTAGTPVSLSSFKGKYVLVDFWASWCGPCRGENPNVVAAFNKYKDKNFTVLGVSLDQPGGKDKWLQAIKDDHLNGWTQVSDLKFWNNEVAQLYGIRSIPQNFLIGPDGKIVGKNLRGEALDKKLKEILD